MRRAIAVLVLSACHAAPRATPSTVATPSVAKRPACAVRSSGPVPEVVRVDSIAAAKPHLVAVTPDATEDLDALIAERGPTLLADVLRGAEHGSDTMLYDVAGVFVTSDRHVVIAKRVALRVSAIPEGGVNPPPSISGPHSQIEMLSPRIGHIQIVGPDRTTDHFVDLDRGAYLLGLESAASLHWRLDDTGPVAGDCAFYWDD